MKKVFVLITLLLISLSAMAQRSEGTGVADVNGRSVIGGITKLTSRGVIDGIVVVAIKVDQYGTVTEAVPGAEGSTITNGSVLNATRSSAMKTHFNIDADAPAVQDGSIVYTFVSTGKEETDEKALKFMGIPIDGSKDDMVAALMEKGFKQDWGDEYLTGIFNGENVKVFISTNHGIVDRIRVVYPSTNDSNDTRVKFNTLLSKMNRNAKYVSVSPRPEIPAGESVGLISYGDSKHYDTAYFFLMPDADQAQWKGEFNAAYKKKYTKPVKDLSYDELEEVLFCLPTRIRSAISGIVWLAITNVDHINIYYDNLQNRPRGEDL